MMLLLLDEGGHDDEEEEGGRSLLMLVVVVLACVQVPVGSITGASLRDGRAVVVKDVRADDRFNRACDRGDRFLGELLYGLSEDVARARWIWVKMANAPSGGEGCS